jgi:NodT family efflux transporter outer membrane factor (OMF) lipoprotein
LVVTLPLFAGACTVGPDYKVPSAIVPASYKEAAGWTVAQPSDDIDRGAWWSIYNDPTLDGLEHEVNISNQNLKASEAAYRESLAVVQEGKSGYLPTLSLNGQGGAQKNAGDRNSDPEGRLTVSARADWDLDVWGRIRRTVESDSANAQASAADLALARLSAQATLGADYFQLRGTDETKRLFDDTIDAFSRSLKITQNRYATGVAAESDVAQAQTQLQQAQAQGIDLGVERATLEHAIAILVGKPPADLTITPEPMATAVPVVPTGLPSTLLERRADISEAERKMAAANAQIGVAQAAFYPDITLSAVIGAGIGAAGSIISASNTLWSIGASIAETVFDGGLRQAQVDQAKAVYDQSVALYRGTVLAAFRDVEDQLASLRVLEQEAAVEDQAVKSAQEATRLAINEYKAGTIAYTQVVVAQTAELVSERNAVTVLQNRLTASVGLIEALGGGWSTDQLPSRHVIEADRSGATQAGNTIQARNTVQARK